MTPQTFRASLPQASAPARLTAPLEALWWSAKGQWDQAHSIVMGAAGRDAAWVHAYLHRLEGDLPNAAYWYRMAGRPVASGPLEEEWGAIVDILLVKNSV